MMRDARHSSEMATMINGGGVAGVVAWWWWLFGAFGSLGLKCTISRGADTAKFTTTPPANAAEATSFVARNDFGPLYAGLVVGMRVSCEWLDPDTTTGPRTDHRKQTGATSEPRQWCAACCRVPCHELCC